MGELTKSTVRYLAADKLRARELQQASRAKRTWEQNRRCWSRFSSYLGSADPWKAGAEEVAAWCASLADRGYNPHSIESALCSLNFYYERLGKGFEHGHMGRGVRKESPCRSPLVRATMRGIRLTHARPVRRIDPLMLDTLEKMIDIQPHSLAGLRNRAFLALGWGGALRATEISGLDLTAETKGDGFIEVTDDGIIVVLKRSKTNRGGYAWEKYAIPMRRSLPRYCPRGLVLDWLAQSGIGSGPLFPSILGKGIITADRMDHHTISGIVQIGAERVGLQPERYSSRSLRSGCVTWLIREGVPPTRVMEHSGHRSYSVMLSYVRGAKGTTSSPLADTRWAR